MAYADTHDAVSALPPVPIKAGGAYRSSSQPDRRRIGDVAQPHIGHRERAALAHTEALRGTLEGQPVQHVKRTGGPRWTT
jgi:hypothetical protein